ncbi:MAG: DMT family transporter [Bacilli bacterium]
MNLQKLLQSKKALLWSAIAVTLLWGSAVPLVKVSYQLLDITSTDRSTLMLFAGYRFTLSGLFIFLFMMLVGEKDIFNLRRASVLPALTLGFFQTFLQYVFFYLGLSIATGIEGAIIAGTGTFFQIIYARAFLKTGALAKSQIVGLIIGFCGVLLINIPTGSGLRLDVGLGEGLLLLSVMTAACGNVYARTQAGKHNLTQLTAFGMLFGGLGLTVLGLLGGSVLPWDFTLGTFLLFLYLAALSAIGFVVWNILMSIHEVTSVSAFMFLIPVFGVLFSSLFLNEELTLQIFFGLSAVAFGIMIVNGVLKKK